MSAGESELKLKEAEYLHQKVAKFEPKAKNCQLKASKDL